MKDFKDKVAVITGAASGIGLGLANRAVKEGMKVVLADINEKRLRRAERRLKRESADVLAVLTDASKASDIKNLAQKTLDSFGGHVHLLFNNAGVAIPRLTWEYSLKEWEFVLGVNLMGVIHGIRTFVPIMIEQDTECHIINTSSIEGILSTGIGGATYGVSKHSVLFISERLALELAENGPKIKISVLCPGYVQTKIFTSAIRRLLDDQKEGDSTLKFEDNVDITERMKKFLEESPGLTPDEVADIVFQAIINEKFYILTHTQQILKNAVKERFDSILKAFDD